MAVSGQRNRIGSVGWDLVIAAGFVLQSLAPLPKLLLLETHPSLHKIPLIQESSSQCQYLCEQPNKPFALLTFLV